MKKITFYIGANNVTKIVERDKALSILGEYYSGMNFHEIGGVWSGEQESSIKIEVVTESVDLTMVKNVCKRLNSELDQQAIMVEIVPSNALFISER